MNATGLQALATEQRVDAMVADMRRAAPKATPAQELAAFVIGQQLTTPTGSGEARRVLQTRITERRDRGELPHFEERLLQAVEVVRFVGEDLAKKIDELEHDVATAKRELRTLRTACTPLFVSTFTNMRTGEAGALVQRLRDALDEVRRAAEDLGMYGDRLQPTEAERAAIFTEQAEAKRRRIEARAKELRREPKVELRSRAIGMQLDGWSTKGRDELATMIATAEENGIGRAS